MPLPPLPCPPLGREKEAYPTGGARGVLGFGAPRRGSSLSLVVGPEESSVKEPETLAAPLATFCAALLGAASRVTPGCHAATCFDGGYATGITFPCAALSAGRSSRRGDAASSVRKGTGRLSSACRADRFSPRPAGVCSTARSDTGSQGGTPASGSAASRTRATPGAADASAGGSGWVGKVPVSYWFC